MSGKQKIYLLSSTFPPMLSGVGDHTAFLAAEIDRAGTCEVKVLTAVDPAKAPGGFAVERVFDTAAPRSVAAAVDLVEREQPDWMLLQYDPFSYGGRCGFNPSLIAALRRMRRRRGQTRLGLIVHESFIPAWNWRSALLSAMLKSQLWCVCQSCDAIFTAVEPWAREIRSWFPGKRVEHLPVGSNLPLANASKPEVRRQLNIAEDTVVLGCFGHFRGSRSVRTRNPQLLTAAVEQAQNAGLNVRLLYLGMDADGARELLGHLPLLALGPLPAEEVSVFLAAVDVYLLPIVNGVSTRRGSLMCALQHGLPIVATSGPDTDQVLRERDRAALWLVPEGDAAGFAAAALRVMRDGELRKNLSAQAQALYRQEFAWNQISAKLLTTLAQ